jgi:hypothetical protein
MRSFGVPGSVKQHVSVKQRERGFDEPTYVESFLVLNALGGECIEGADRGAGARDTEPGGGAQISLRTSVPVIAGGALRRAIRPQRILAGILALRSGWPTRFHRRLPAALARLAPDESLDLGLALRDGAFESLPKSQLRFSTPEESLIFFMLRLLTRLRALGTAPAADLMAYGRNLESFSQRSLPNRQRHS